MYKGHKQSGFTLIEILIALALVAIILMMAAGTSFSPRQNVDEMINKLERIIRFAHDEATLKNQFVRLTIELDTEEQNIKLEASDDSSFVLDPISDDDEDMDKDTAKKKQKKLDQSFSNIAEFDAEEFALPVGVKFIAVGSSLSKKLFKNSKASIYFYPTGEKDSAIIILGTESEISTVEIKAFSQVIDRSYTALEEASLDIITEKNYELADGIYKQWIGE